MLGHSHYKNIEHSVIKCYDELLQKYYEEKRHIYIATGVHKSSNKYKNFLINWMTKNPLIKISDIHGANSLYNGPNREVAGLIDFINCINAEEFVGFFGSSFSISCKASGIKTIMINRNKNEVFLDHSQYDLTLTLPEI